MATITIKRRWEWVIVALEIASVVGGILVAVGLWIEGWKGSGPKLVIVGVVIETFVSGWVLLASRKLQAIQERELETMRLETAEANARAAEANLALEKLKTPRTLTPEQRERITREMRTYFGQGFAISAAPDPEARELASAIETALISAGWQVGHPPGAIQAGTISLAAGRGVQIEWHSSSLQGTKDSGTALAKVLEEQGLATTSGPNPRSRLFLNALGIAVGTKPQ